MSTSKVNMSLDDIIKQRKGRGGGRGGSRGGNRGRGGNSGRDQGRQDRRGRGGYQNFQTKRRNFGERRRYLNKDGDRDNKNSSPQEDKRTRLFVSNLQKEIVNSELRVYFS
jgi:hypothetical protein